MAKPKLGQPKNSESLRAHLPRSQATLVSRTWLAARVRDCRVSRPSHQALRTLFNSLSGKYVSAWGRGEILP